MRAPISVIVPTLNAGFGLHHTLSCLMEALDAGLIREVIVSDAGSTDQTLEIAKDWGAEVVSGAPSRGGQLQRGCDASKGEWVLVLHADKQAMLAGSVYSLMVVVLKGSLLRSGLIGAAAWGFHTVIKGCLYHAHYMMLLVVTVTSP